MSQPRKTGYFPQILMQNVRGKREFIIEPEHRATKRGQRIAVVHPWPLLALR